jgi:[ribosomal protein S5]-alanine N-acetyltransferase
MFIRTARLFLRPCWPEDRHEMLAVINDGSSTPNVPALPFPLTPEDAQRFLDRPGDKLFPHFFIILPNPAGGEMIGGIGLGRDGEEVGLGYWIAKRHRGHGYGPEAISALLSTARTLGHKRVIASHSPDNPGSGHVLEAAGFKPTGEVRSVMAQARAGATLPKTYVIDLSSSLCLDDEAARTSA